VSITYRLGLLGFLGGPRVEADGNLNVGLLDQRAGLEWIQRHISKFGGDPNNVSISGESAGGASMMMQAVAYGGRFRPMERLLECILKVLHSFKAGSIQACNSPINRLRPHAYASSS
jgi:hypothetical protein